MTTCIPTRFYLPKVKNKWNFLFSLLSFALLLISNASIAQLPNIDADDCNGQHHNLYDDLAAGKTVILNFCAGWCVPCREADLVLEDIYQRSCTGQADVEVYGMLFEDFSANPTDCVFGDLYASTFGLTFPIITDMGTPGNETHVQYFNNYSTFVVPVFFIIQPNIADPANSQVNVIQGNVPSLFEDIAAFLPSNSIMEIEITTDLCMEEPFSAELSSSFPSGNQWSTGESTQNITVSSSGVYYLNNSLGCGTDSIDVQFIAPPIPGTVSTLETEVCEGVEYVISYSGGTGTSSFWEFFDDFGFEWVTFDIALPGDYTFTKTELPFDRFRVREENSSSSEACVTFSNEIEVGLTVPLLLGSITAPDDVLTVVYSNCEAGIVSLGAPTFTSTCGVITDVTNDAPPSFPLGGTIVNWFAIVDGAFVTDIQLVEVIDPELPTITAPDDLVVVTDLGVAIGIDFGVPVVADNCTITEVVNDAPGIYPIGDTQVIWTVFDVQGNSAQDVQTITINQVPLCPTAQYYIPLFTDFGPMIQTCFDSPAGYELADQSCAEQIALNDSYCTDVIWDDICLQAYNTCLFGCESPGCIDENACNYDSNVLCDNGTCEYPDTDGDSIIDCFDPCPLLANTEPGDSCDDFNPFTTNDQIQFDCQCSGEPDSDADGLSDEDEINVYFTNPLLADTDGEGLTDRAEIFETFTNPSLADTDSDGCSDLLEFANLCPDSPVCGENDCPSDVNSDGITNTSDLNAILSNYGSLCP